MNWFREIGRRLWTLIHRNQFDSDLDEEMRLHRELRERDGIERGLSPKEAHYAAQRRFGNDLLLREKSRDVWGWSWLENVIRDVRSGLRALIKNPAFTAVVVLTLALGIGANTVVFGLINATVLHVLPYPRSDRLVEVYRVLGNLPMDMSVPDFGNIESETRTFESLGCWRYTGAGAVFTGTGEPATANTVSISPNVLKALRAPALLGRTLLPGDAEPGKDQVLILSYSFWQEHLGGDRAAVGKTIVVGGNPRTIVGVMRPVFAFPNQSVDTWTPEPLSSYKDDNLRNTWNSVAIGRLKDGVTLRQAQAEMDGIAQRLGKAYPDLKGAGLKVLSLQEETCGPAKKPLLILFGAVGLVLLIACTNVANLVLARNARRAREFAVRHALGASRFQIMRSLFTESLVLATLGGCVAVALAFGGIQFARAIAPRNLVGLDRAGIDGWVLGFTLILSILTGATLGVMPAFRGANTDLTAALKEGKSPSRLGVGGSRPGSLPRVLAAAQVALAVMLLFGAGLLLRSFSLLLRVSLGFDPRNVLTARFEGLPALRPVDKGPDPYEQALEEVRMLPGVESAALASGAPLGDGHGLATFSMDWSSRKESGQNPSQASQENLRAGRRAQSHVVTPGSKSRENPFQAFQENLRAGRQAMFQAVTPDSFATMRIPIVIGRGFAEQDRDGSPDVIIINQAMARRFWPGQNPVGKRIDLNGGLLCQIIGVAGDARDAGLETEPGPLIYRARSQEHSGDALLVRTALTPLALSRAVEDRLKVRGLGVHLTHLKTMQDVISGSVIGPRFHTTLLSLFAGLALVLAGVGTFGVVTAFVTQHNHDIGVRLALGAQLGDVLRLVLKEGMAVILPGISIGLAGTLALSRLISSLLYGVTPTDPLTFLGVIIVMAFAVLLACYFPSRRAMHVDPLAMLRYE